MGSEEYFSLSKRSGVVIQTTVNNKASTKFLKYNK
jgi:hypothetical protein